MAKEGIAFGRGLIDRYIQFKMLQRAERQDQLRLEFAQRREQRYDQQLQQNRRFGQSRIDIAREHLDIARTRAETPSTSISVFSPGQISGTSQTQGVDDVIAEELDKIIDKSGRGALGGLFRFKRSEVDRIKSSDIETAKQNSMSRLGIQHLGPGKNQQFDFLFNRQLDALKSPESGRTVEIVEDSPTAFPSSQTPQNIESQTVFQSGRVEVVSPEGRRGNIPRSQLQDALNNGYRRP